MQELKIHTEKEKQKLKVSVHLRTDAREATEGAFQAAVFNLHDQEPKPAYTQSFRVAMHSLGTIKNSAAVQLYHSSRLNTFVYK